MKRVRRSSGALATVPELAELGIQVLVPLPNEVGHHEQLELFPPPLPAPEKARRWRKAETGGKP